MCDISCTFCASVVFCIRFIQHIFYFSYPSFWFQTNFNTVLAREKMKKESIINDLSDKLKMLTQQQEKDKGKQSSAEVFIFSSKAVPCTADGF